MNKFLVTIGVSATLLSPVFAGNETDADAVKYLDSLKTCTRFTLKYHQGKNRRQLSRHICHARR